jgi:branched-chain amino acid transport system permease protein
MVVLYRATGVLNLAFGAIGAFGAFIAWQLINHSGMSFWPAFVISVLIGGLLTLAYGMVFGPALALRDPLVKATATLGLALILLGVMDLLWPSSGGASRALTVPTDNNTFQVGEISVTYTNVLSLVLGLGVTVVAAVFLRFTKLGTAMRAMANDREITASLGVPVRRVTAAAWFGCGCLAGVAGVLLSDLVALDATTLTFLVISTLAATLVGRLRSIPITFLAAIVIGVITAELTPISSLSNYRDMTPFVVAAIALLFLSRRRVISVGRQGV